MSKLPFTIAEDALLGVPLHKRVQPKAQTSRWTWLGYGMVAAGVFTAVFCAPADASDVKIIRVYPSYEVRAFDTRHQIMENREARAKAEAKEQKALEKRIQRARAEADKRYAKKLAEQRKR